MEEQVIIVAGGLGKRFNSEVPKQFIKIKNKTVIEHTLDAFLSYNSDIHIVIVVHPDYLDFAKKLLLHGQKYKDVVFMIGGEERYHSVKNGLLGLKKVESVIGIHDAARPLVSQDTIRRCFEGAKENGNAIPAVAVKESLRILKGNESQSLDRRLYKTVQTPQCFDYKTITECYERPYKKTFTDDASVAEEAKIKINLVEGNSENIKITTPTDLYVAQHMLK